MNRAQMIEDVQRRLGPDCSRSFAEQAVTAVLESIGRGLVEDGSVQLVGFGSFDVRERAARDGVHPVTREPVQVPALRSVRFRAGARLKDLISDSP